MTDLLLLALLCLVLQDVDLLAFASDASRNTTGAELTVDGGMLAQLTPNINRELWK